MTEIVEEKIGGEELEDFIAKTGRCREIVVDSEKSVYRIGEGDYGLVYRAYSTPPGAEVAIKIAKNGRPGGEQLLYGEQRKWNFESPALLEIYYADHQLVVMEFCGHGDLASRIDDIGPARLETRALAEENFLPLLEAVSELHRCDLVHGDIKPNNLLVGEGGVLKLGDFGLARRCEADGGLVSTTDSAYFCGTPLYSCPELMLYYFLEKENKKKHLKISLKRNDGWALGLTTAEAIFNKKAQSLIGDIYFKIEGATMADSQALLGMWEKILSRPQLWRDLISDKFRELKPPVKPALEWAVKQLLEPDPAQALSLDRIAYEFRKKEMAIPTYLYPLVDVLDLADSALRGTVDLAIIPTLDYLTDTVGSAASFVSRRIQSLFGQRREEEYNSQRLGDAESKLVGDSGSTLNIQTPGEARARTPGLAEATGQLHFGNENEHSTSQELASTQLGIITDAIEDSSALGGWERDGSQMKI